MDRAEAVREMTFEEEAVLYQKEAKAIFAKEDVGCEASPINHTVRRGMRIIRKAREEIAALREQESLAQATSKWVSVKERLPKPYSDVLAYRKKHSSEGGFYTFEHIFLAHDESLMWSNDIGNWKSRVTHWMPLPEPPKEGADNDKS